MWLVIGHERLSLLIIGGGATGALTTIGRLIIFLILLKIGWEVSTCVRMTPMNSFLYQTTHSTLMTKSSKWSIYVYHWMIEAH